MHPVEKTYYKLLPWASVLHGRPLDHTVLQRISLDHLRNELTRFEDEASHGEELVALVTDRAREALFASRSPQFFVRLLSQIASTNPVCHDPDALMNSYRLPRLIDHLVDLLMDPFVSCCRRTGDSMVVQLKAVREWLLELPHDDDSVSLLESIDKMGHLIDSTIKRLPQMDTDCHLKDTPPVEPSSGLEIDPGKVITQIDGWEDALRKDLTKRCDAYYRRYFPDHQAESEEKVRFSLGEISDDHPEVHEIPDVLNQLTRRLYRIMKEKKLIPESYPPPDAGFAWFRSRDLSPWQMWHLEEGNLQKVSIIPPTPESQEQFQKFHNYARLEVMAMHISARGILYRTIGRTRHPHWIPREHIEGWQFYWARRLIAEGYGKGDLRLRIMLLREELLRLRQLRAVINYHFGDADEQEIATELVDGGFISDSDALTISRQVIIEPWRQGVGYRTFHELLQLRRKLKYRRQDRMDITQQNLLLMQALFTPPGTISSSLNTLMEQGSN